MRDATLCFLVRGELPDEVLLGLKKTGFGAGKYGGFGGKIEAGETVVEAAIRELEEESGVRVRPTDLLYVGHLTFLFPSRPAWSQVVHVFLASAWAGDPAESVEMRPAWFRLGDIPFERMWQDGVHWLPRILAGERLRGRFTFQPNNETLGQVEFERWNGDG